MTNCTVPSDALRHFSPIDCMLLWYEVPAGARVPSLSRMGFSAAWRPGVDRHRLRVNRARRQIRLFIRGQNYSAFLVSLELARRKSWSVRDRRSEERRV